MSRVVGLDIGGSGSRARLSVDGSVVAEAFSTTASWIAAGPEAAAGALDDLLAGLPLDQHAPLDAACAGAAGSATAPEAIDHLRAELGRWIEPDRVVVIDDLGLVVPSAGLDEGIGLVSGTGSGAVGHYGARTARAGGWGYLLGDEGSGYWMVRRALGCLLRRRERGQPAGPLLEDLTAASHARDLAELHRRFYAQPQPKGWAALAPAVLDGADPAVDQIVQEAAAALDQLVAAVAEQLAAPAELPIVLGGGLLAHPRLCAAVQLALARSRPGSPLVIPQDAPVAGAVRLAEHLAAGRRW